MQLKIKKLYPAAKLPTYATPGAACFDLHAIEQCSVIFPGIPKEVGTGLAFEVPEGYVMLVFSRSGHGFKYDTRLANCVGVIDSDYRGEVRVKLTRDPGQTESIGVEAGDRIAQAMLVQIPQVELIETNDLSKTRRGTGGYGSTGR